MITIRIGGIEVDVDSVATAAELIAALGERGASRLLPAAVAEPKADTRVGPPAPRVARAPRPAGRHGRKPAWDDDEIAELHARLLKGARLDELAAPRGRTGEALRQAFKKHGLPVRFARPNADPVAAGKSESGFSTFSSVPVKKLAPGASGLEDDKGSYRRVG